MRTYQTLALASALLAATSQLAHADVAGVYEVKYDEVSTNCATKQTYPPGKLEIKVKGAQLIVDIDRTPQMLGAVAKAGKISAKSKLGGTMIEGMKGVFSVAGRVTDEGNAYLVMVAEYSANGRALCTQSWNVTGPRAPASAAPAKPGK